MPAHSVGDQRWVPDGVNEAGDPVYSRYVGVAEVEATDAAERLAAELGVDLASVQGTGKDGKVTVGDVKAASG